MIDQTNNELITSGEYTFQTPDLMMKVLGPRGEHLAAIQHELNITTGQRGDTILLKGEPRGVDAGIHILSQLVKTCRKGRRLQEVDVVRAARILSANPKAELSTIFNDVIHVTANRRIISPKGLAQKEYVDAIRTNDLTFGIGPAGTGKTYLAVAAAVSELLNKKFRRIIITRPAVEAGERLGFLPGDLAEKINPYLRPLYDALNDMLGPERTQTLIGQSEIEIAPLAFMRGRTLNDSFVILDEAQNTTREQMKMFLTRLGYSSKAVVTGDISQIDLPWSTISGLVDAEHVLKDMEGIAFCRFSNLDVVRHQLVQQIIKAYETRGDDLVAEAYKKSKEYDSGES